MRLFHLIMIKDREIMHVSWIFPKSYNKLMKISGSVISQHLSLVSLHLGYTVYSTVNDWRQNVTLKNLSENLSEMKLCSTLVTLKSDK